MLDFRIQVGIIIRVIIRHQHSGFEANIKRIRVDNDVKKPHIHSRCMTFGNLSGTEQDFKMTFSKAYWKVRVLIFKENSGILT